MSVYAHRIIRIITVKKYVSFDLWKNRTLVNFLNANGNFYHQFYSDGTGITEASVEMLEKAVKQARLLDLDTATVDNIKKDIKWAKKHGHEFIQYLRIPVKSATLSEQIGRVHGANRPP